MLKKRKSRKQDKLSRTPGNYVKHLLHGGANMKF